MNTFVVIAMSHSHITEITWRIYPPSWGPQCVILLPLEVLIKIFIAEFLSLHVGMVATVQVARLEKMKLFFFIVNYYIVRVLLELAHGHCARRSCDN